MLAFCGEENETMDHLFFSCPLSKAVCFASPCGHKVELLQPNWIKDDNNTGCINSLALATIFGVLYALWLCRSKEV